MHDSAEDRKADATDQLLTAALHSYAKPRQRYGLEARLLAAASQERNTRRPRFAVWLGVSFAAVAAILLIVVCLPEFHARPQPEAIKQLGLPATPAVLHPNTPAHARLTAFHRVRKAHRQQAPQTISRPFPQLAPSRQEVLLLNLTEAQGKALVSLHNANPTPTTPLEISAIHIEPINDKPLDH